MFSLVYLLLQVGAISMMEIILKLKHSGVDAFDVLTSKTKK